MLLAMILFVQAAPSTVVELTRDNVDVTSSCAVRFPAAPVPDADGDGVLHVAGNDLTIDFAGLPLRGALPGGDPDSYSGAGIVVTGRNITLRNLKVSGFKVGLLARKAPGLTLENVDVSDNFRQRLRSTPKAESGEDWLFPHGNDRGQWIAKYGAGVCVQESDGICVRGLRARNVQNGLVLDRVNDSRIYDNDCSFLSGWGLAMWRSSRNVITRNAFDFCIRGYSHGVYNRGQDSAGILMFEQCCGNFIAENSVTHGGDGLFGFAGEEALKSDQRLGNNGNIIVNNDFSHAAAHGIEMTFSFDNRIVGNRLVDNAICGVWGGYSQSTLISGNVIEDNGRMGYGAERGGVNIEHGHANVIASNTFRNNACGVHLWYDVDPSLNTPWGKANERKSTGNFILDNTFDGDAVAVQLRRTTGTVMAGNQMQGVEKELDADSESTVSMQGQRPQIEISARDVLGQTNPVGARSELRGRDKILMTQWGPYDWRSPHLHLAGASPSRHSFRLLGEHSAFDMGAVAIKGAVNHALVEDQLVITPGESDLVTSYALRVQADGQTLTHEGVLFPAAWQVKMFPWTIDPRQDQSGWREAGEAAAVSFTTDSLDFAFGGGGPSQLELDPAVTAAKLPIDRFGLVAKTAMTFPQGRWRIRTSSDDGLRVLADQRPIINDWTWHAPKPHEAVLAIDQPRRVELEVLYFELDGHAVLSLEIESAD